MIVIGICGEKFSGKDTIADFLVQHHGFQKLSYAGPLKRMVQELFLMTDDQVHDPAKKEIVDPRWGISPRTAMQILGTDWVRNQLDPDFWTKRLAMELKSLSPVARVVIPDVRFLNEKQLVLDVGGQVIGVVRPSEEVQKDLHESETGIHDFFQDLVVFDNSSSRKDLYQKIDAWLQENKMI